MATPVPVSHSQFSLSLVPPEGTLSLWARPSRIPTFPARPRPTTITAFRATHGDAFYPQLLRSWTT
jgi:hypothetical protein